MARRQGNYPDRALLDELTDAQRNAVIDGAEAIKDIEDFRRRSFDKWMTVARGVAPLCELADRPGTSRKARKNLLADNGYGTLNESTISRLLLMAKHETAIRIWRDAPTMTQHKRDTWNSPTSICNRCPAVRAAIAEAGTKRPPRAPRKSNKRIEVERALDVLGDYLSSGAVDADERAALLERIVGAGKVARDEPAPVRSIDEAIEIVAELLQDEAPNSLRWLARRLGTRIQEVWNQRRKDGEPHRSEPAKKAGKGKAKKGDLDKALKEVEGNINRALGSLFK
jgi:hypothetical protein